MSACTRRALYAAAPFGVLAFWGGLWLAGRRYPSEYDWRYMTISSLVYADRNPAGYRWAWGGLMLCALGGLCWTMVLARDMGRAGAGCVGAGRRPVAIWALGLGYLCMVCCALSPAKLQSVPKAHEILALCAFFGVCVGIVQLTFRTVRHSARLRSSRHTPGALRFFAGLLAGIVLAPIALAAAAPAYVSWAFPDLPWVGLRWRALGMPVYLSFAFWEWMTCGFFSVYAAGLCLATHVVMQDAG
jgi:hypothetical protein